MSSTPEDWPPRLTITPEGAAGLFLMSLSGAPRAEDRDKLVEIFKMYYDRGYADGLSATSVPRGDSEPEKDEPR